MIANANTVVTNTHLGEGLLKKQMNKIRKIFCCGEEQKNLRHKKDVQATALDEWLGLVATIHVEGQETLNKQHGPC